MDQTNEVSYVFMPPNSSSQKTGPTAEQWEALRAEIHQLYIEEAMTLREVMEIMEQRHQFRATPKMYKARLKKWGMVKNNKINEVRSILVEKHERDKAGKPSTFTRGGREVDIQRLHRYIKRKGVDISEMTSKAGPSNILPQGVICRTPSPELPDDESIGSFRGPQVFPDVDPHVEQQGKGKGKA